MEREKTSGEAEEVIANHYGYGLRNDEKPFAHKIPPGGNWRDLTREEQSSFWNGKIPTEGGSTNGLRRRAWDEPAGTITTTPFQKLSCQLHPGYDSGVRGNGDMYDVTPQQPNNGLTVAELFAGGGLMAVGLKTAGYNLVWANDFDKNAVKAYRHNLGDHIVQGDITAIDIASIPDADVFAGGPPCQDYSVAGKGAGEDGERGKLVYHYLDIIRAKKPKAFIFENVKGLVTKKHIHTFNALLLEFELIGYNVSWKLINAWDYGVAQKRERVFIVGIREDLGFTFEFPEPRPEDYRTQVLRDVIGDLPEPNNKALPLSESDTEVAKYIPNGGNWKAVPYDLLPDRLKHIRDNMSAYRSPAFYKKADWNEPAGTISATMNPTHCQALAPDNVPNHDPKDLSEKALDYLQRDPRHLQKHRPPSVDEPSPTLPAVLHKGVPYGLFYPNHVPEEKLTRYVQNILDGKSRSNFGKMPITDGSDPARTLLATYGDKKPTELYLPNHNEKSILTDEVFGDGYKNQGVSEEKARELGGKPRRFTVRECLRIQSVPDWYVLPDDISLSAQYRIVGNGVASRVAYLLGVALAEQLKGAR